MPNYKCEECGAKFRSEHELAAHMGRTHGTVPEGVGEAAEEGSKAGTA